MTLSYSLALSGLVLFVPGKASPLRRYNPELGATIILLCTLLYYCTVGRTQIDPGIKSTVVSVSHFRSPLLLRTKLRCL